MIDAMNTSDLLERTTTILNAAKELLIKQKENGILIEHPYTVFYDESECDGYCLLEDISIVLDEIKLYNLAQMPKTVEVYQLKDTEQNRSIKFRTLAHLKAFKFMDLVTVDNYDKVYACEKPESYSVEDAFFDFNFRAPKDYKARKVMISDVLVFTKNGTQKAWYVDALGFTPIQNFFNENNE